MVTTAARVLCAQTGSLDEPVAWAHQTKKRTQPDFLAHLSHLISLEIVKKNLNDQVSTHFKFEPPGDQIS